MAIPLRGGMRVALHSLSTATDLNGIVGTLGRFCSKTRRWAVDLSSKGCRKVKSENLLPLHNGNDADITPKKSCKVKLCRFGNACWRPGCHFSHPDEEGRRLHWVSVWSTDSCDAVQEVKCVKDFNEDIVELKKLANAHESDLQASIDQIASMKDSIHGLEQQLDAPDGLYKHINHTTDSHEANMTLSSVECATDQGVSCSGPVDDKSGDQGAALLAACEAVSMRMQCEVDAIQKSWVSFKTSCTVLIDERLADAMQKFSGAENPDLVKMCREMLGHMSDLQSEVSELSGRRKCLDE